MARIAKRLVGPVAFTAATATLYTVPAGTKTIIRHIHVSNPSATPYTFTLCIGLDAAGKRIFDAFQIPGAAAGVTASVVDHYCYYVLETAEVLTGFASNTAVTVTVDGDESILS